MAAVNGAARFPGREDCAALQAELARMAARVVWERGDPFMPRPGSFRDALRLALLTRLERSLR